MTILNLKRRAGIQEQRNAEGDAILLTESLLRSLKRYRQLSERDVSKSLILAGTSLKRQLMAHELGPDVYRIKELAGLFEDDENDDGGDDDKDESSDDDNNGNQADYGYETNNEGKDKESNSAVTSEMSALHSDMMDCLSSLRKCVMDCTIDGDEVPSTIRTTIDKLGRAIEQIEQLAGKV
ncbi:MAG: hypothetical protein ACTSX2_03995 [Candidatus Thorarchaeota archaeon]